MPEMRMGKIQLLKHITFLLTTILLLSGNLPAQDLEAVFELIHAGQRDSAETALTEISYQNPGHPGVRYAHALLQTDALKAAGLYKDIVRNHSSSPYMAGALMHLGEYYFAQGLYVQSRQAFNRLIRKYPEYGDAVNAVNLSLRAGVAARLLDSVYIDLTAYTKTYPGVAFDIPQELDLTRMPAVSPARVSEKNNIPESGTSVKQLGQVLAKPGEVPKGDFRLQAGAFGNYDNARRLADQIESIGYAASVQERQSNGKQLFVIFVGDYEDRTAAMSVADILEAALGIPSFPVAVE